MKEELKYPIGSPEWEQMMKENEGKKEQMERMSAERIAVYRNKLQKLIEANKDCE